MMRYHLALIFFHMYKSTWLTILASFLSCRIMIESTYLCFRIFIYNHFTFSIRLFHYSFLQLLHLLESIDWCLAIIKRNTCLWSLVAIIVRCILILVIWISILCLLRIWILLILLILRWHAIILRLLIRISILRLLILVIWLWTRSIRTILHLTLSIIIIIILHSIRMLLIIWHLIVFFIIIISIKKY